MIEQSSSLTSQWCSSLRKPAMVALMGIFLGLIGWTLLLTSYDEFGDRGINITELPLEENVVVAEVEPAQNISVSNNLENPVLRGDVKGSSNVTEVEGNMTEDQKSNVTAVEDGRNNVTEDQKGNVTAVADGRNNVTVVDALNSGATTEASKNNVTAIDAEQNNVVAGASKNSVTDTEAAKNTILNNMLRGPIRPPSTVTNPCRRTIPDEHYDGTCARLPTENDLISPIDMKHTADFHFGHLSQPEQMRHMCKLTPDVLPELWDGVVIFVDTPALTPFVRDYLPQMTSRFVLVSGDSDAANPNEIDHDSVTRLLQHPKLLHWYAMNCEHNPNPQMFTCLFLGVSQWDGQRENIAAAFRDGLGIPCNLKQNKTNIKFDGEASVIVSFRVSNTNPGQRGEVWAAMCGEASRMNSTALCYFNSGITLQEHYRRVSRSRFVPSPPGAGLDCYRTYEALYLGSYPIVKRSSLDEMYKDLPVLIVDSWDQITPELLNATYTKFRSMSFDYQRLFKWYWFNKFRSHLAYR